MTGEDGPEGGRSGRFLGVNDRAQLHIKPRSSDWAVSKELPVTVRSFRPSIAWAIVGIFAVMGIVAFILVPLCLGALPVLGLIGYRMSRLGFVLNETGLKVVHFFSAKRFPRERVTGFGTYQRGHTRRLAAAVSTTDRPVLLPTGEDLLIPAEDIAPRLNELYGIAYPVLPWENRSLGG
jgi:hypothetical protein